MNRSRLVLCAVFVFIGALVWFAVKARTKAPTSRFSSGNAIEIGFRVGQQAPEFELRSLTCPSVRLSALRGKPVLLNFWATWCAPCRVEMPWLVQLDGEYRTQGVQIVGISMDDTGAETAVNAFARERGVSYPVLLGNSAVADSYGGVRFMPQSFFIDADGKILKTTVGLPDKRDLEDGVKALAKSVTGNKATGPNLRVGQAIPQSSGTDQFGRQQTFDSLRAQVDLSCSSSGRPTGDRFGNSNWFSLQRTE